MYHEQNTLNQRNLNMFLDSLHLNKICSPRRMLHTSIGASLFKMLVAIFVTCSLLSRIDEDA